MNEHQFTLKAMLGIVFVMGVILAALRLAPPYQDAVVIVAVILAISVPVYWFGRADGP